MTTRAHRQIHRAGENYTHDELEAMLRDLASVEPHFVADYKREFVRSYARHVVHCDADVAVFDTFAPGEAPTRSFVFTDRLHLVQSEVALALPQSSGATSNGTTSDTDDNSTNSSALDASGYDATAARVDRQTLTLGVHRAMCVALALLPSSAPSTSASPPTGATSSTSASSLRVAVIGAGAGALPLFLLEHVPHIAQLDAVEPSAAVNRVAHQFFGLADAERTDARLRVHECFGEAFVAAQLAGVGSRYDLVLLDVEAGDSDDDNSEEAEAGKAARGDPSAASQEGTRGIRAPPASMLSHAFLGDLKALLTPTGVLVVNVIAADDAALKRAETALARGFGRNALLVQLATNAVVFLFGDAHPFAAAGAASSAVVQSTESTNGGVKNDTALQRRVLEMLAADAFQTQRVRSLALLQQHAPSIRRIRALEA